MKASCVLCGQDAGVTKEHLWPDWVRKLLLKERGRPGKSGCMSDLENEVKPFMSAMVFLGEAPGDMWWPPKVGMDPA